MSGSPQTNKSDVLLFDNLNAVGQNLVVLEASSAQGLLDQIKLIRQPTKILSVYADKGVHTMWILTTAKIKKG